MAPSANERANINYLHNVESRRTVRRLSRLDVGVRWVLRRGFLTLGQAEN